MVVIETWSEYKIKLELPRVSLSAAELAEHKLQLVVAVIPVKIQILKI